MEFINFIINHWYLIVAAIAVLVVGVIAAVKFIKRPSGERYAKVREWLLFAVIEAEKAFGDGTGQLKLRSVYDQFVTKFPVFAIVISFDRFSKWVDEALDKMQELLQTNDAVAKYVKGE
jgi:hypothetical protein